MIVEIKNSKEKQAISRKVLEALTDWFILEQLSGLNEITHRSMMGEYILYYRGKVFGGSFGAGVIAKTMCVCPDKVKKVALYVPSGIKNAPAIKSAVHQLL